ncbi:ABC transporter ATP-binding protein [Asanoa sp. WMMD1127]|uniref:ABC transporter ATP-binding protein n=1 Tax=Asanoa sp. WMMD1127 TaxID=3016107 RepID=UPI0024173A93|nr:ABC transporter ATP-binding protein [Asanoa sp. WMMD1127]MDG4821226.1 ABC transporter ATP-binding protein [Asanoa sp. WMMD1127]
MRLDGVSYRYGRQGRWVLRDICLDLPPGGTVVVLGRNGVGKSTLLQLVAGVLRPSRGRVHDRPTPVGWVPERFPADQPFTVAGYLTAMARLHPGAARHAIDAWVDRLGLEPYRGTRLAELSKGTAQKVGLAQALIPGPKLLVLDEPWEGLDAAARDLVPGIVAEVVGAGGIVLVSDHRGETGRLPGATTVTVADGTVTAQEATPDDTAIIEIQVPAATAEATAEALRADGHDVVAVRTKARV